MKKIINLLSLLFFFTLVSCAQPTGETQSSFQVGIRDIAAIGDGGAFPGGLMLFGKSGDRSFGRVLTSDIQDEVIPNGTWDFYVIGWDAPDSGNQGMSGKVYCALQKGVDLVGEPTIINLNATNAACERPIFGKSYKVGDEVRFAKVDVKTCNDISAASPDCVYEYNISSDTYKNGRGVARSYQIVAHSFNAKGLNYEPIMGEVLKSSCAKVDENSPSGSLKATETFTDGKLNVPGGALGSPFSMLMRSYLGSDNCVEAYGAIDIPMLRGASPNHGRAKTLYDDASSTNVLYVKSTLEDVCARPAGSFTSVVGQDDAPFRGGSGTKKSPFIICDGKELNSIQDTYASNSFILAKDIDLNPYTKVLNDPLYPAPECSSRGENFHPIGAEYDSNCDLASSGNFTGVFDGNGKVIKGLRVERKDQSNIGFIPKLSGTLMNVVFDQASIEGKQYLGLVGRLESSGFIYNIKLYRSDIEAKGVANAAYVGGLVGYSAGNIKKIFLEGVNIESDQGDHVGGAIGKATAGSISEVSFKGRVDSKDGIYIGGVVGYNVATITAVASRGSVIAEGQNIGGIAGTSDAPVSDSYSHMYISTNSDNANLYIAGLVGNNQSTVQNSYFSGMISHGCNGPCSEINALANNAAASDSHALINSGGSLSESDLVAPHSDLAGYSYAVNTKAYPILKFELEHNPLCASDSAKESVSVQLANLDADSSIVICRLDQLHEALQGAASGSRIELGESINVGIISSAPQNFSGEFNGNGNSLMGINLSGAGGLFNKIDNSSVIKNLNLLGTNFSASSAGQVGLLAVENHGEIKNVTVAGSITLSTGSGSDYYGLLVAINEGDIFHSKASGYIVAPGMVGGLVGLNRKYIYYSEGQIDFSANSDGAHTIGALVANNEGKILESKASGRIDTIGNGDYSSAKNIGLLAGLNSGGVYDSLVDLGSKVAVNVTSSEKIGGFVGQNSGTLEGNISFARVEVDGVSGGASFGGFVGSEDTGSSISGNYFQFDPMEKFLLATNFTSYSCASNTISATLNSGTLEKVLEGSYFIADEKFVRTTSTVNSTALTQTFFVTGCLPSTTNPALYRLLSNYNNTHTSSNYDSLRTASTFTYAWPDRAGELRDDRTGHNADQLLDAHYKKQYDPELIYPMAWEIEDGKIPKLLNVR